MFKLEIRILGFDDGPFTPQDVTVPVIGVIYRGGNYLDVVLRTDVKIDGLDATEKIINLINSSRHKPQLKILMFDGITLGGFNLVDINKINKKTGLSVIAINRKLPNLKEVQKALKNFKDYKKRWNIVKNTGEIKMFNLKNNQKIYYQAVGLSDDEAEDVIQLSSTHSQIPEPLRVAHIIATAIVKGESGGRA